MPFEFASAIAAVKAAASIAKEAGKLELYEKILDLRDQLMQADDENRALRRRVDELEEQLRWKERLVFRYNVYWGRADEDDPEWPYCPRCWDAERKAIRLVKTATKDYVECRNCKTGFMTKAKQQVPDGQGGFYGDDL